MMLVAPELPTEAGFDGLLRDLDEATLSRVQSEHFLPGSITSHWHAGEHATPQNAKEARTLNVTMRFSRYGKTFSPRSWLGVLLARYRGMVEEKVCTPE